MQLVPTGSSMHVVHTNDHRSQIIETFSLKSLFDRTTASFPQDRKDSTYYNPSLQYIRFNASLTLGCDAFTVMRIRPTVTEVLKFDDSSIPPKILQKQMYPPFDQQYDNFTGYVIDTRSKFSNLSLQDGDPIGYRCEAGKLTPLKAVKSPFSTSEGEHFQFGYEEGNFLLGFPLERHNRVYLPIGKTQDVLQKMADLVNQEWEKGNPQVSSIVRGSFGPFKFSLISNVTFQPVSSASYLPKIERATSLEIFDCQGKYEELSAQLDWEAMAKSLRNCIMRAVLKGKRMGITIPYNWVGEKEFKVIRSHLFLIIRYEQLIESTLQNVEEILKEHNRELIRKGPISQDHMAFGFREIVPQPCSKSAVDDTGLLS